MLKVYSMKLGDVAVLSIQGPFNKWRDGKCETPYALNQQVSAIVLDLSRVTAIDARGLGVMLELQRQTALDGIRFKL